MNRQEVLEKLEEHRDVIRERFGIKRLAIFGSIARDEAGTESDLDVLIEFDEDQATFEHYMDLKFYLEDLFDTGVDLVTNRALRPALRPYIEKDAIEIT